MAKLILGRTYYKYPSIWGDPDTSNNRIFLNNYGYDFTTLAPKLSEIWLWQARMGTWNHQTTSDFDNYGPIQLAPGMDGCAYAGGEGDIWYMPGIFNLWQVSLDYGTYKCTRAWKSTNGRVICSYPRSSTTSNTIGDWWQGYNMSGRSLAWEHSTNTFYSHLWEHTEDIQFTADSWSYSGTTITVNKTSHGFWIGDEIEVTGASADTNDPNGRFVIIGRGSADAFTYQVPIAPTGAAAGTMVVTGTARRGWGVETEGNGTAPNVAMRTALLTGYSYNYGDDTNDANSTPTLTSLDIGTWKFWLGQDGTYAWYVGVAGGTTNAYDIYKYELAGGIGTETTELSAQVTSDPLSAVIMAFPSNLRHDSATKKVFYSGHMKATGQDFFAMKFEWNPDAGTITKADCTYTYPSGTAYTNFAAQPTASNWNGNGYNVMWSKPHQFVDPSNSSNVFITHCLQDGFFQSNQARFPTLKSRVWMTYASTKTNDNLLDFHSGINFSINDFPLSWVPYNNEGDKIVTFSINGTTIWKWSPLAVNASLWEYETSGSTTTVTVSASNHGFSVGDIVTISGTTADSNPPNGIYTIAEVTDNSFIFYTSSDMSGTPTGTAGGTMNIKRGWKIGARYSVRARGYSIDSLGRLWVTARATSVGRVEIHLITDDMPSSITVKLQSPVEGTENRYVYEGSNISTNVLVDAYDSEGNRMSVVIDLTILGDSMEFNNGASTVQITTSDSQTTSVPITITGAGKSSITAEAII